MHSFVSDRPIRSSPKSQKSHRWGLRIGIPVALIGLGLVRLAFGADPSDPIINLFLRKGFITEQEAAKARSEIEALRTNEVQQMPTSTAPLWRLDKQIKNAELFGDIRLRYERRSAEAPGGEVDLDRARYAVRLGVRGEVFDDFYYGLRLETSSNPRSPWVSFATSSSGTPFYGPFGKSTSSMAVGQAYLGWHPWDWVDLTVGKMPNPLFTTPMVWDPDLSPEGAAEHVKYQVGKAELFATFGQFLYQDVNPSEADPGLGFNGLIGQKTDNVFQIAWQAGLQYQFTTNTSAKLAATLYQYIGLQRSSATSPDALRPYFGDPFIGEGAYLGPGSGTIEGGSSYGTSSTLPGYGSYGFPLNQVGVNDLQVIELPLEVRFKLGKLDSRVFGDFAYNLEGKKRAEAAAQGYADWLANQPTAPTIQPFAPQRNENHAYQIGFALGSQHGWPMGERHPWELKTFWQHTEQYALDPNLPDSDVFEGRGNLEGAAVQLTYGLTPNFIASVRYAHATRINKKIGTGGSSLDIPQVNPIDRYNLLQLDLSFRF